jgi:hypothetical protein
MSELHVTDTTHITHALRNPRRFEIPYLLEPTRVAPRRTYARGWTSRLLSRMITAPIKPHALLVWVEVTLPRLTPQFALP